MNYEYTVRNLCHNSLSHVTGAYAVTVTGVQESCILQSSQFLPTHSFRNLRLTLLFKYSDVW